MKLTSTAFPQGAPIPRKHTGEGPDVSPQLAWTEAPAGVKAFALVCDDPDAPAGTWVHWVLYDIPAGLSSLPEGVPAQERVLGTAAQGPNDSGSTGYSGPMPPRGKPHRYFFKLYALDAPTGLGPGATKDELLRAIKGRVLAEVELMGTYKR